jgi:hypothetical protein
MTKRLILFLTVVFLFIVSIVFYGHVAASEERVSRVLIIEPQELPKSYYFGVSENIDVRGDFATDVYVIGGNINIDGNIEGDVIALGGSVLVNGNVSQNLIILGGDVNVNGKVGKNIVIGSGSLNVLSSSEVGGGIIGLSGRTQIDGPVGGEIKVITQELNIRNKVGGDVETMAENINLMSEASISGILRVYSNNDVNVASTASISGGIEKHSAPKMSVPKDNIEKSRNVFNMFGFIGRLVVGLVMIKIFSKMLVSSTEVVVKDIWNITFKGALVLFFTPLLCLALVVTLVGIHLSLILFSLYLVSIYLSKLIVAFAIGNVFLKIKNHYLAFAVGLLIIYLLSWPPAIGGIFRLWVSMLGLGMMWVYFREKLRTKKDHLER